MQTFTAQPADIDLHHVQPTGVWTAGSGVQMTTNCSAGCTNLPGGNN
jgi:hypothetical protein